MGDNILSCNLNSYGKHRDRAFDHLRRLGVRFVEIPVPALEAVDDVLAELERNKLRAASLAAPCDASQDAGVDAFAATRPVFEELEAPIAFVSVKQGDASLGDCYARLRRMAEAAASHDVTIAVETHEPFGHNADVALRMLEAVDHPNLRLNFDTGNIYYYNENVDALEQLRRVAPYVVAVHLKDTMGGYKEWNFPALGMGVVDFRGLIGLLNERGFHGPFAMELEGVQGQQLSADEQLAMVSASVAYLRGIELF